MTEPNAEVLEKTRALSQRVRGLALDMVYRAKASHIGSCFSVADLLAVLYGNILRIKAEQPDWSDRDRLIFSKGHAAAILYATLAEVGFFPAGWLKTYCHNSSPLTGHVTAHGVPGVEVSTGSLGHGLSIGCGMALAARADGMSHRIFVIMSDGECDEGSIWEAALFAGHHKLDNLIAIIDYNKIQSFGSVKEVLDLEPLKDKWQAFRWSVREINGHDHEAILSALSAVPFQNNRPSLVIAHTIKGKGISFMENRLEWHYKSPTEEQLAAGLTELGA